MKLSAKLLFSAIILAFTLNSCFEKEVFSDVPEIEFESLDYIDRDGPDSLVIKFSFKDENGDIGLGSDEVFEPYNSSFGVVDANEDIVTITGDFVPPYSKVPIALLPVGFVLNNGLSSGGQQLFRTEEREIYQRVGDESLIGDDDPRPAVPSCGDFIEADFYEIIDVDPTLQELSKESVDIFLLKNEFHHNFHIDFYRKQSGSYSLIDFDAIFNSCTDSFDGRIPVFDPNGKEGFITYVMLSQAWRLAFLDDTIQARFYIYDRSLNKSNEATSPDFVLRDL